MERNRFKIGDWVQHKNFIDLGHGRIIYVSEFKKYTVLFKTCFLKYCSEKFLSMTQSVDNAEEPIRPGQKYIPFDAALHDEELRFYENILDLCSLNKIWLNEGSDEYKYYSNLLGMDNLESGITDLKNEIIMNIQEQIIGRKINPNILTKENKSIIQVFFEMEPSSLPLHIELQILRFLLEYTGGSDTIPPFKNGPCVFRCIVKKFTGIGLPMALNILLDSGMDVEKTVWEIMDASILPNPNFNKEFRNYIINILCDHLPNRNECSICFENIGYKLSCCMRPDSDNYVCHECYVNTTSCPFCRDTMGTLMNPSHERLINHIFTV
jgi:hypothetical protein